MHVILASASPRRHELLLDAGYAVDVMPPGPGIEDAVASNCSPAELVERLAIAKASDVVRRITQSESSPIDCSGQAVCQAVVLAADTVAECDGHILGKPADAADARRMLRMLSGRKHRVLSGVCLWPLIHGPDGFYSARVAETVLRMDVLTDDQLDDYLASGQWRGKAGAFGYQDRLGWVHVIDGSESNVVGLPMELVAEMVGKVER